MTSPPAIAVEAGRAPGSLLPPAIARRRGAHASGDRVFRGALRAVALAFIALVGALIVALAVEAWPAIRRFGWGFLVGTNWDPVAEHFGALPFVYTLF